MVGPEEKTPPSVRNIWLQWPICPNYKMKQYCDASRCHQAHPPEHSFRAHNNHITVCFNSLGLYGRKCFRENCRFYHPPPHIKLLMRLQVRQKQVLPHARKLTDLLNKPLGPSDPPQNSLLPTPTSMPLLTNSEALNPPPVLLNIPQSQDILAQTPIPMSADFAWSPIFGLPQPWTFPEATLTPFPFVNSAFDFYGINPFLPTAYPFPPLTMYDPVTYQALAQQSLWWQQASQIGQSSVEVTSDKGQEATQSSAAPESTSGEPSDAQASAQDNGLDEPSLWWLQASQTTQSSFEVSDDNGQGTSQSIVASQPAFGEQVTAQASTQESALAQQILWWQSAPQTGQTNVEVSGETTQSGAAPDGPADAQASAQDNSLAEASQTGQSSAEVTVDKGQEIIQIAPLGATSDELADAQLSVEDNALAQHASETAQSSVEDTGVTGQEPNQISPVSGESVDAQASAQDSALAEQSLWWKHASQTDQSSVDVTEDKGQETTQISAAETASGEHPGARM